MVGKIARFMAPVALAAVAVGVFLIVQSTLNQPSHPVSHPRPALVNGRRRPGPHRRGPRFYVVKSGDTLSSIADKTGVSMSRLTGLNRTVASSPNSLRAGQRLRLRR